MAKKSLTDLLREEVEKSPEVDSENVRELYQEETSLMSTPNRSNIRRSSPTKAELEATVAQLKAALKKAENRANDREDFAELKDALEESHKKEELLQQQITDLQSELQQQKEAVTKFKKELKELEQLKTEFEQAKNAAVQLAEANEKLTQEVKALKKHNEEPKALEHKVQERNLPQHQIARPIQKESEKPVDFAKKEWLL